MCEKKILLFGVFTEKMLAVEEAFSTFDLKVVTSGDSRTGVPIATLDAGIDSGAAAGGSGEGNIGNSFVEFMYACDRESINGPRIHHIRALFHSHVSIAISVLKKHNISYIVFANIPHQRWGIAFSEAAHELGIPTRSFLPTIDEDIVGISKSNMVVEFDFFDPAAQKNKCFEVRCTELYKRLISRVETKDYFYTKHMIAKLDKRQWFLQKCFEWLPSLALRCLTYGVGEDKLVKNKAIARDCGNAVFQRVGRRLWLADTKKKVKGLNLLRRELLSVRYPYHREFLKELPAFCYFPLHYQPEATSVPMGLQFSDQLRLTHEIATHLDHYDLPLIVKEHPSIFKARFRGHKGRFPGYYKKLDSHPNIIVVADDFPGELLVNNAQIVFTITGTAAAEKALLGGNAVIFGSHFIERHRGVHRVSAYSELPHTIQLILVSGFRESDRLVPVLMALSEISGSSNEVLAWLVEEISAKGSTPFVNANVV